MKEPTKQSDQIAGETFVDLNDGRIITRGAPSWLSNAISDIVREALHEPANELATRLLRLLDDDDHHAAALLVVTNVEGAVGVAPSAVLTAQLRRITVEGLSAVDRAAFQRARALLAAASDDYETAGADAKALLASPHAAVTDRAWLRLTVATAALKRGALDSSFAVFREIAESDECAPNARAWAYRNMSVIVPLKDERCEEYSRRSSDLFLICGDKLQAAGSLVRATLSCLMHRPSAAREILSEPIEWFAGQSVQEQYLRGGLLQNRARAAWMLQQYTQAFDDAVASANALRGLTGAEVFLATSLLIAIDSGRRLNVRVEDLVHEQEALATANHGSEEALRHRLVAHLQTFDAEAIRKARACDEVQRRPALRALVAIADARSKGLAHVECLQVLETALQDARGASDQGIEAAVLETMGEELLRVGNMDAALAKFGEVLQREPLNLAARQNYAFVLQQTKRHREGVRFLEDQQKLWGERPGMTFFLARFLFEAGDVDRATTIFARLALAADAPPNIRSGAATWRDKAVAAGGRIQPSPPPAAVSYTRSDLENELRRFADMIKRAKRMTFWRKGDNGRHKWVERPESHAKHLLYSFLEGAFKTGLKQFEEIGSGAGRIDLYIELAGSVSAIIELKMLGAPYSSTYALQGEDQIAHYMDNRLCHLGYLVVFDARSETWGELPDEPSGSNTIVRIFVDVRPDIPSKPNRVTAGSKNKKAKR